MGALSYSIGSESKTLICPPPEAGASAPGHLLPGSSRAEATTCWTCRSPESRLSGFAAERIRHRPSRMGAEGRPSRGGPFVVAAGPRVAGASDCRRPLQSRPLAESIRRFAQLSRPVQHSPAVYEIR
jgi:hypothetical protein